MKTKRNFLFRFCRDVRGISSVEYALLLAFVGVGIVTAAGALGTAVSNKMEETRSCLASGAICN